MRQFIPVFLMGFLGGCTPAILHDVPIEDCSGNISCHEARSKIEVPWSRAHEDMFQKGLQDVLNTNCRIAVSAGQVFGFVLPDNVMVSAANCRSSLVASSTIAQAIVLLRSKKIATMIEFKRLKAFSSDEGLSVNTIVYYSYSVDPKSGLPLRDSFSQYEFYQSAGHISVRLVAHVAS
jgi:hypothetical protein